MQLSCSTTTFSKTFYIKGSLDIGLLGVCVCVSHPPQSDQDPVGLGPGSLLVRSQQVLHHGHSPGIRQVSINTSLPVSSDT